MSRIFRNWRDCGERGFFERSGGKTNAKAFDESIRRLYETRRAEGRASFQSGGHQVTETTADQKLAFDLGGVLREKGDDKTTSIYGARRVVDEQCDEGSRKGHQTETNTTRNQRRAVPISWILAIAETRENKDRAKQSRRDKAKNSSKKISGEGKGRFSPGWHRFPRGVEAD